MVLKQTSGWPEAKLKTWMHCKSSMTRSILRRLGGCKPAAYHIKSHVNLPHIYHYVSLC
ncbi:hypothetical protein BDR03DRAFT_1043512 [Suillus americanus]|nr:hypothetical protein BDR03DRAFT_1043512 [Suillus americanus]